MASIGTSAGCTALSDHGGQDVLEDNPGTQASVQLRSLVGVAATPDAELLAVQER